MVRMNELMEKAYLYLKENNMISLTKEEFKECFTAFESAQGAYVHFYTGANEIVITALINRLLNVTKDDLDGYDNALDWLMRNNNYVYYIEELKIYLVADKTINLLIHEKVG